MDGLDEDLSGLLTGDDAAEPASLSSSDDWLLSEELESLLKECESIMLQFAE